MTGSAVLPQDKAVELLVEVFYGDLRRLARRERGRAAGSSETLGTTALVHEAYIRLARQGVFGDRAHFLNTAALAMRQVLVSHARARLRDKRGGGQPAIDIDLVDVLAESDERIAALDDALNALERSAPRLARVVECRYFAGYSDVETARALGISERSVRGDWTLARAWLHRELAGAA